MSDRNIGIFGAGGEIGRNILRINAERRQRGEAHLPITHLVEGYLNRDQIADLLRDDPVRGAYEGTIETPGQHTIRIDGENLEVIRQYVDEMVNWSALYVWGVLESSGARVREDLAQEHISPGGAKKVVVTAPAEGTEGIAQTLIMGYNEGSYDPALHHVLTNESCTTKSALHVAEALRKACGLHAISLTTVHAETGDEKRRLIAASATVNDLNKLGFMPKPTGSQGSLTKLFSDFHVHVSAEAYRVPVADGSVSDITFKVGRKTSLEEVRAVLDASVKENILEIVATIRHSSDLIGNMHDAVVAGDKIAVVDGDLVRVSVGYDNAYAPARAALDAMAYIWSH